MTSLVSRENRAVPSWKGGEKMQGHRQTLSEMSENTMHHATPEDQPDCFTPKRQLPRSPLRPYRSPRAISEGSEKEPVNVQDVRFTPTHVLKRSPVARQKAAELKTACIAASAQTDSKQAKSSSLGIVAGKKSRERTRKAPAKPASKTRRHATSERTKDVRKTQAACFTPTKALTCSPTNKRRAFGEEQKPSDMDEVPPLTRWEIPRTPVQQPQPPPAHQHSREPPEDDAADTSSVGVFKDGESRLNEDVETGPVPFPDPPLPRWFGNEAVPDLDRGATTGSESKELENGIGLAMLAEEHDTISTVMSSPTPSTTHSTGPVAAHHSSPSISADREFTSQLPGLVCTENDLAYLQRMKNVKQYEQLQARVTQLDKDLKATAQRKEQLDHETLKINQDLEAMRTRYCGTVSALHGLVSTQSGAYDAEVKQSSRSDEGLASTGRTQELTQSDIAQLKRVHHLTSAQLEKTGKELTSKLSGIELQKQELEKRLKDEEANGEAEKQKLHSQLHSAKEQRSEWETKVQEAVKERAAIETKLTELQSRVSRLKLSSASSSSDENPRHSQEAKTRAEERLRRIIQRCELYVQRHQMLREMGVKGRRGN